MKKPLIGVTLDFENGGGYSKMPWYAIRQNYCDVISKAGGVALPLPHSMAEVEDYFRIIDGLVVTGGNFDVDPALYGEAEKHSTVTLKENRTRFEWTITELAIRNNKPVLGICGGEQLLNVVLGGTLIQHIPDAIANALEHEQKNPRTEAGHRVNIKSATLLHKLTGMEYMDVNTAHHQAVRDTGKGVTINSTSEDGVIEGIEYPAHPFCLGVQWHPEYEVSTGDIRIFEGLINHCR